jgi:hypothetical protein
MKQAQIKSGISTETLEFKFQLKVFDDCEQVKQNSIISKCISKNTPESFASNRPILSTSALFPV